MVRALVCLLVLAGAVYWLVTGEISLLIAAAATAAGLAVLFGVLYLVDAASRTLDAALDRFFEGAGAVVVAFMAVPALLTTASTYWTHSRAGSWRYLAVCVGLMLLFGFLAPAYHRRRGTPGLRLAAAFWAGLCGMIALSAYVGLAHPQKNAQALQGFFGSASQIMATLLLALVVERVLAQRPATEEGFRLLQMYMAGYVVLGAVGALVGLLPAMPIFVLVLCLHLTAAGFVSAAYILGEALFSSVRQPPA